MTKVRKLLLVLIGLPVLLALAILLYLEWADLSGWSGRLGRAASRQLGRELTIAGGFEADMGAVTRLVFEDVALANPSWSEGPALARADRLEISLSLWSLVAGPVRIVEVRLQGAALALETDAQGRGNWELDFDLDDAREIEVVVEALELVDAEIRFRSPSREEELSANVERLELRLEEGEWLDMSAEGAFRAIPFQFAGRVGPLEGLLDFGRLEQELTGRLGDVELSLRGTLADLSTLTDPDLEIQIASPDVATVSRALGLPSLGTGALRISGEISPLEPGGALEIGLNAAVGDVEVRVDGRMSALREPGDLELTLEATAPDPTALGPVTAVDRLPSGAFAVSGIVRHGDSGTTFESVAVRLGDHRLSLDGVLTSEPQRSGSEVAFEAEGRDLSDFAALAGLDLPAEAYRARGHVGRRQQGIGIDALEASVGSTRLWLDGTLESLSSLAGARFDFRLASQEPSAFDRLAGFPLPSEPIGIEGRIGYQPGRVNLESVVLSAADSEVRLNGILRPTQSWVGTDLELRAAGRDLARVASLLPAQLPELPAEPYQVSGRIRALGAKGYQLEDFVGSLSEDVLRVDGRVSVGSGLAGTGVSLHIQGPDLSRASLVAGLPSLPPQPYEVSGRLDVAPDGYVFEDLAARAGDLELEARGRLGQPPELEGTELDVELRGPRVSDLSEYRDLPPLPADPFAVAGRVRVEEGVYRLEGVTAELGTHRASASGALGPFPGMDATDLALAFGGPDARSAGLLLSQAGLDWFPELPADRYALSGALRLVESGYRLSGVEFALGGIEGRADAALASFARAAGMELTADVRGPDASVVGAVAGVRLPAQPFAASGRVELLGTETRFHGVRGELGDNRAELDGTLGKPPRLVGTRLDVRTEGLDTSVFAELLDHPGWLPDQPYEVAAHLEGSSETFLAQRLRARFGPSDLTGSLRVDLRDKPDLRVELRSERLDLPTLLGIQEPPAAGLEAGDAAVTVGETPPAVGLVIGDEPFKRDALQAVNAEVLYLVEEVTGRAGTLRGIEINARLRDGRLEIERGSVVGERSGSLSLGLTLESVADGYHLLARAHGSGIRAPSLTPGQNLEVAVPLDFDLWIDGSGGSPRAVASDLNGHLIVALGKGRIDLTLFEVVAARLPVAGELLRLAGAFNPLHGSEDYTGLECAVMVARIEDGVVELAPVTTRLEYLEVHGVGRVDLETEEIAFRWATKPRGMRVGLASAADSFVKIGGTLASPEVESKPLEAATTTGLAIGTAGLSLAADGLFKRLTAERKLCKKVLKVAQQARDEVNRGGS